jgi:DNA repair exonuclease SbcCD nuclease subunit
MAISFIHTADWQIGRPFGNFDERKRTLLREARVTAIDRIANAAQAHGAPFVLVAGDVFDSPTVADQLLRQTLARLAKHAEVTWHLLPGNHDPLRAGGVWDRLARMGLPANVIVQSEATPIPLGSSAMLLPAPLTASASGRDPTAWMDEAVTPPGMPRIGLAHGSVRGFGSEAQASQQIAPSRARTAGLAYLALGDWHGAMSVSDRVWYSGTPEPDRYPDNEPGYVIAVRVEEGSDTREPPVTLKRVRVGHFSWSERHAVLEQASDWDRLAASLADGTAAGAPADRQLVKLILRGAITLAERSRIEAGIAQIEPAYFHFEANLDALHDRAADDDMSAWSDDGVRTVAARLRALANDPGNADAAAARHALRKLVRLDAQATALSPQEGA